jgi:predicted RNA methylase
MMIFLLLAALAGQAQDAQLRTLDVFYVPTPQPVVDAMLTMARVTDKDVVYDLGCGDGRIPITAALKYGAASGSTSTRSGSRKRTRTPRRRA